MRGEVVVGRAEVILGERDRASRAVEPLRVLRTWAGDRRAGFVTSTALRS